MGSDGACEARGPSPFPFLCSHEAGQETIVLDHAVEELVAELGAAYLVNEIGLPQSDDLSNVVNYLSHWVKVLQRDHTAIFSVAAASSAAVDSILEYSRPKAESDVEAEADAVMA